MIAPETNAVCLCLDSLVGASDGGSKSFLGVVGLDLRRDRLVFNEDKAVDAVAKFGMQA